MISSHFRILYISLIFLCNNCSNSNSIKTENTNNIIINQSEISVSQIASFLIEEFDFKLTKKNRILILISDKGCIKCNKSFSKSMEQYTNRQDIVFIITATGGLFNVEHYYELSDKDNILIDRRCKLEKIAGIYGSGALFITNKSIYNVVINSTNLYSQIAEIKDRIGE